MNDRVGHVMQSTARHNAAPEAGVDRGAVIERYRRNRARTRELFDLLDEEGYYSRPIPLRHPPVFYEGHLPAFSFNTLVKRALGGPGIDARLESLFARGIDPDESKPGVAVDRDAWPGRDQVRQFVDEADRRVVSALESADLERPGHPLLERAEAVYAILEHEAMHQETLRYLWHRLPPHQKRRPSGYAPVTRAAVPTQRWIAIPRGRAVLGVAAEQVQFSWDNERPAFEVDVPAFAIEQHDTTNASFLEFVEAGGYRDPRWWRPDDWAWVQRERVQHPGYWAQAGGEWHWRGMFGMVPLPPSWPVYVTWAEANAYARWRGARLPSEAEYQRAAYASDGPGYRPYPWGARAPDATCGVFDFSSWDPEPAGSHPAGRSAWDIDDLLGNGWEWTSSVFAPFPGFRPLPSYPEYSADFFDGEHVVLKGASPATASDFLRPSFRNWFRPRYPHVYATFRCARAVGT